jgi:hypothetical protein
MKANFPRGANIHYLIWVLRLKLLGNVALLTTSKVLDVRRRGAIACPPLAGRPSAGGGKTQPFGFAQGHEPVEWQMMP